MSGNSATAYNLNQHTPNTVFKVAILGAESTGKTTLCRDLAKHFKTLWVPEYMRSYLQNKWDKSGQTCSWEDLLPIAQGQIASENKLTLEVHQFAQSEQTIHYLFCDTSLFELMVYANWYYGDCPDALTEAALTHHYDLILLTEVDVPWVADDLRDSPHERDSITERFKNELNSHHKPFRRIGGDREQRVQQVVQWLHKMV